jgi:hypothetical protein
MALLVYSLVRRHMKRTSPNAFTVFDGWAELPAKLKLAPDESVIGWYRNPPPWEHSLIIFTSAAFYVVDGQHIERIALSDVVDYETPKSKADVTGVRVMTKDGFRFVRIAGSFGPSGNQKDAYSFIMILHTLAHVNREQAAKPR